MRLHQSNGQTVTNRTDGYPFGRGRHVHQPARAGARLLAGAAALSLLVAGCSGTDAADPQTSPSPSPSTNTASPSGSIAARSTASPATSPSQGSTGSASPSATRSLNLKPKAGTVDPLIAVKGYTYGNPAAETLRVVAQGQAQYDQVSTGRVVRSVRADGKSVAQIASFGLDKQFSGSAMLRAQLLQALVLDLAGEGASPASQSVGGAPLVAGVSDSSLAVGWYTDTGVVVVVMPKGLTKPGLAFVAAYLKVTGGTA